MSNAYSILPWQRYWCPLGSTIDCGFDGSGFLTDPTESYGRFANASASKLRDLLPASGPLVLCGEPGIGKSTELELLWKQIESDSNDGGQRCWIDFKGIADWADFKNSSVESIAWKQWQDGSGLFTLIVDGVDEGLFYIANFVGSLKTLLKDEPIERLRLILACRTAKWPTAMGQELLALWPATESARLYELCPLLQTDALEAAEAWGCSSEAFLEAVWDRKVAALASRPITLFFLLDEFGRHGVLPDSHRELYVRCTRELAREVSPHQKELRRLLGRSPVPDHERLRAAQRLACLLLVTGGTGIRMGGVAFQADEHRDILTDETVIQGANPITTASIEEAVESALFTSLGAQRYQFIHRTVAECLASEEIQRLPLVQIRSLLCQRDERGEHVIPQLTELAAWVAVACPEFGEHLLRIEPEALLQSDVAKMPNAFKARLVETILSGAQEERIFDSDGFDRFLSALGHPGLDAQLRPVISKPDGHLIARRIAIKIAGACRCTSLIDCLLERVLDGGDVQHLREQSASALEDITPNDQLHLLEPLARGEAKPDPNASIQGHALMALIPRRWTIRGSLVYLNTRSSRYFHSYYDTLLGYYLPRHLAREDLEPILKRAHQRHQSSPFSRQLSKIEEAALAQALRHLDDPALASVVADIWQRRPYGGWHQISNESEIVSILQDSEDIRRQLAKLYLNHPGTEADWIYGISDPCQLLQGSNSLDWLLDQIIIAPVERRAAWASAVRRLTYSETTTAPCWDKLLQRIGEIPELAKQHEWLRCWNMAEPELRSARARWLKDQRREARQKKRDAPVAEDKIRSAVNAAFERFIKGDDESWYSLWYWLVLSVDGQSQDLFACDLSALTNWQFLTADQRQEVPAVARAYLLYKAHHGRVKQHDGRFFAARCAVWMLRESLSNDSGLRMAVLDEWLDTVVFNVDSNPDPQRTLFECVYKLSPERVLTAVSETLQKDAREHRHPFILRVATDCWDEKFSNLAIKAIESAHDPKYVLNALDELAARDLEAAAGYCETILAPLTPRSSVYPIEFPGVLTMGLIYDSNRFWDSAEPFLRANEELAKSVLGSLCHGVDRDHRKNRSPLSVRTTGKLYMMLRHWFPPKADPPHRGGEMTTEDVVRYVRGSLPGRLAARGTEEACRELLRLSKELPNDETLSIRWAYKDAVVNVRRNQWQPPSLPVVQRLLKASEARLLSSSDDLLELVQESLDRLQIALKAQSLPRSEDLWSWTGNGTNRKDFVPKDEDFLSGYVAEWLSRDLGLKAGVVVGREVQPRPGARADIVVEAVAPSESARFEKFVVIIETKGCWHRKVRSGGASQLVSGYLEEHGWRCGLYLVGWYVCSQWQGVRRKRNQLRSDTFEAARAEVVDLVSGFDGTTSPYKVSGYVLDCTLPTEVDPSSRKLRSVERKRSKTLWQD